MGFFVVMKVFAGEKELLKSLFYVFELVPNSVLRAGVIKIGCSRAYSDSAALGEDF